MDNILLLRPNHTEDKKDTYISLPLGLGYIGSSLLKEGYNVLIIDLALENVNYNNLTERIKKFNPKVIGISALSFQYIHVKKLVNYLKSITTCKIILGGFLATYNYNIVLEKILIDICILGEGELTIIKLLKNLDNLSNVSGIAYKENNQIIATSSNELIKDLDSIPFPAYHLFDIDKYSIFSMSDMYIPHTYLKKKKIHKQLTLIGTRGCPFACNFCSKMNYIYRPRSLKSVIEEIKYLKNTYDIDIFGFHDELLFSNFKQIQDFLNILFLLLHF